MAPAAEGPVEVRVVTVAAVEEEDVEEEHVEEEDEEEREAEVEAEVEAEADPEEVESEVGEEDQYLTAPDWPRRKRGELSTINYNTVR